MKPSWNSQCQYGDWAYLFVQIHWYIRAVLNPIRDIHARQHVHHVFVATVMFSERDSFTILSGYRVTPLSGRDNMTDIWQTNDRQMTDKSLYNIHMTDSLYTTWHDIQSLYKQLTVVRTSCRTVWNCTYSTRYRMELRRLRRSYIQLG